MKYTMDFFEKRAAAIKNFNRLFNTILICLNIAIIVLLKCLESQRGVGTEDNNAYKFLVKAISVAYFSLILCLTVLFAIQKYNKVWFDTIAIANNFLLAVFFQIISGLFRSYLFYTSDPLLFIISVEIIIRYLIVNAKYPSFKIMAYSTFFILSFSWVSMVLYHIKVPSPIIFYNTMQTLVFSMLTLYAKTFESTKRIESELMRTGENERNYYIDILDNLNIGFFISKGAKIHLFNKNILNLMKTYNKTREYFIEDDSKDPKHGQNPTPATTSTENASKSEKELEPFTFLKFLYEEKPDKVKEDLDASFDLKSEDEICKIEEFIEMLLSNFQSFTPKANIKVVKLLRSSTSRKLQLIKQIISDLPEFKEFYTVGRIKLTLDIDDYQYFDISFRISKRVLNNEVHEFVEFILNDVTQVIQVEKDKTDVKFKSVILAKIAHEFKNPINTINAICGNLNAKLKQNKSLLEQFNKFQGEEMNKNNDFMFITSLCDYLLFLIEDLNSFVKFSLGKKTSNNKDSFSESHSSLDRSFQNKFTWLNLNHLMDFCYNIFNIKQSYDKGKPCLRVTKNYSNDLPTKFYTNEIKLKQVIINLLSNAYKFTISGFVNLSAKIITPKNPKNKKYLLISVSDTGTGLEKEEINSIFKPFEVVERNQILNCHGSGLGLSIVNEILEQFNTKISVESEIGKGSTFYFELEIYEKNQLDPEKNKILEEYFEDDEYITNMVEKEEKEEEKELIDIHESLNDALKQSQDNINDEMGIAFKTHRSSESMKTEINELLCPEPTFHKDMLEELKKGSSLRLTTTTSIPSNTKLNVSSKLTTLNQARSFSFSILSNEPPKKISGNIFETFSSDESTFKVLICDDEHLIAENIDRLLKKVSTTRKLKIETMITKNGIECIYQVYKESLEGKKIDLLLIDENMPFLLGSECVNILRNLMRDKKIRHFKIFSITGYTDKDHTSYIKNCGIDGFFNKPISQAMINDLLVKCELITKK